jgi:hypothetical protein
MWGFRATASFDENTLVLIITGGESAVIDTICVKEVEPRGEPPPRAEGKLSAIGPCGMQGRMIGF